MANLSWYGIDFAMFKCLNPHDLYELKEIMPKLQEMLNFERAGHASETKYCFVCSK